MTWFSILSAPHDGTRIIGRKVWADPYTGELKYSKRKTWWGKTSHVPLYGWCVGTDPENIDLWEPQHWRFNPLPADKQEP